MLSQQVHGRCSFLSPIRIDSHKPITGGLAIRIKRHPHDSKLFLSFANLHNFLHKTEGRDIVLRVLGHRMNPMQSSFLVYDETFHSKYNHETESQESMHHSMHSLQECARYCLHYVPGN